MRPGVPDENALLLNCSAFEGWSTGLASLIEELGELSEVLDGEPPPAIDLTHEIADAWMNEPL